jgi:hypothetical protein
MTGSARLIFGTIGDPTCEISLDRPNGRLVSSCPIDTNRRHLAEVSAPGPESPAEKNDAALESELAELRREVSELRREVNMLKDSKAIQKIRTNPV